MDGQACHLAAPDAVGLEPQRERVPRRRRLEDDRPGEFRLHVRVPDIDANGLDVLESVEGVGGSVGALLAPDKPAVGEDAPLAVPGLLAAPVAAVLVEDGHAVRAGRRGDAEVVATRLAEILEEHRAEGGVARGAVPRPGASGPPAVTARRRVARLLRNRRPAEHHRLAGRAEVERPDARRASRLDQPQVVDDDAAGRARLAEPEVHADDRVRVDVSLDVVVSAARLAAVEAPHGNDPLRAAGRERGGAVVAVPVGAARVGPGAVGDEDIAANRRRIRIEDVEDERVVGGPVTTNAAPVQVRGPVAGLRVEGDLQRPPAVRDAVRDEPRRTGHLPRLHIPLGLEIAQRERLLGPRRRARERHGRGADVRTESPSRSHEEPPPSGLQPVPVRKA